MKTAAVGGDLSAIGVRAFGKRGGRRLGGEGRTENAEASVAAGVGLLPADLLVLQLLCLLPPDPLLRAVHELASE